jgi:hypothetical protein
VADADRIPFDWDGNVRDSYLEPVEGVVLCTGVVEEMTDPAGTVMAWQGPVRSTCDQTWTTVAEGFASSDPEMTGQTPDTWVTMGLGVGIVKAPDQPGTYVLVVEPVDDAFWRNDSWRIDSLIWPDNFMEIEVGGGVYLDEQFERYGSTIEVPEPRQVYVQASLDSAEPTLTLDIEYTDPDDQSTTTLSITANQIGESGDSGSLYLSEPIGLSLEGQQKTAKTMTDFVVKVGGKLRSMYVDRLIAHAIIENQGPVDLDIDSDNNNGTGLPECSPREEDLETGGGYGKFVFVNHNDDDEDGVPDYADPQIAEEQNLVPILLKINVPNPFWPQISVSFEFDGMDHWWDGLESEIPDPRGLTLSTGFFDYRLARKNGNDNDGWTYPMLRLWTVDDPAALRGPENLILPGVVYPAADLGFGSGDHPDKVVLYLEGLNQKGENSSLAQPTIVQVDVTAGQVEFSDSVRLTVIEADLGVNNSSRDPFVFDPDNPSYLRPGVSDVEFQIDEFDEIVEDQKNGFVFWKRAEYSEMRPLDMFPIAIEVPLPLKKSGYEFVLRAVSEETDADFLIVENVSSHADPLGYFKEDLKVLATKMKLGLNGYTLDLWKLPNRKIGERASYVMLPRFMESLDREHAVTLELVGMDRKRHEVVVDSIKLTLKPLIWDGQPVNGFFWMGSARGDPSGIFSYPADLVAGNRVTQDIQIYPQFSWISGPDPDDQKRNYLAYIHGFNINPDQAFRDSAEIYKRMWWSGYRGNFFALTWHGDEWDPLNHSCDYLPERYGVFCIARFFPNMENAFQTSPRLREFLDEKVVGEWGADPQKINLMVHSLGNLVTLDALRLHSIMDGEKLIRNLVSVEAAVWQETLWDQGPTIINADLVHTEDDLMRGSWAFWFNQNENPTTNSFQNMYNSFTRNDEALVAMKVNDYYPILGTICTYPSLPGLPVSWCPRVNRLHGRGVGAHYRVPVADGYRVRDPSGVPNPDNRPDLAYEIPALLNSAPPLGISMPWEAVTNPLGMEEAPENSMSTLHSIDTMELAWPESEHSWFLEGEFWEIWPWYEFLTMPSGENQEMIIPSGEE